ncbi:Enoyl-[acyl-carrier-protein] reductase [NADH] [Euzebya pacifica]|jgi:enoyl-[acyl-carrier protein] reductase I|uniref:Enoyl-[acyl-carrier-protein] reductase [NADH] n=1 Tax=Euzebya pacifica TaxID=1608957 RepID=A0A346XYM2_9ACTN|nr:enoyl-ACP reductase FabI [Euzebya pacifica]AXV07319.1 Enoyl-[acyl-carrier-protein] reductase [NADH] [Euzebya pacifica]
MTSQTTDLPQLLAGKRLLVTGVLTEASIAFATARMAQQLGAEIVLTGFGKGIRLTTRVAERLPSTPDVLEMDVTDIEQMGAVVAELGDRWGAVDGVVHAIGFAPASAIGGNFLETPWEDVATAVQVSTYSFASLARVMAPLLKAGGGGSYVGLDFDATVAWPSYDWMGVAKAGLESACRYTARELGAQGTRVNLVAAGPLKTMAARQIEGFKSFEDTWGERAPLGWDITDTEPVARVVCSLLGDWMPGVTGEIVHCDGGVHAIGA